MQNQKAVETPRSIGRISHICIHPVKGAAAIELNRALIRPEGIEGDREFMIVRAQADSEGIHHFITQRDKRDEKDKAQGFSVLALIKPVLRENGLELTWDGRDKIYVPDHMRGRAEIPIKIWDTITVATDQGEDVANWLREHTKTPVRLVRVGGYFERGVSQKYLPNGNTLRFQDAYPIHWFTEESVSELSGIVREEIVWKRFRPNVVVSGGSAQSEHLVYEGTIAGIPFVDPKPCDRCPVTTVDPQNGVLIGPEPLRSLATYKKWRNKDGQVKVIFGENMLPLGSGEIKIGDEVIMTSIRDPPLAYGANI